MFQRSFLTGLAVTLLVVQACGSDDGKRKTTGTDAGMGGEAGAEPGPDSGGTGAGAPPQAMGGEPASGGMSNPSTGGMPDPGTAGMPVTAGAGGEAYVPAPELLFSVKPGAVGLENTGIQAQTNPGNAIYTSNTGSQVGDDGTNGVRIVGVDLGLDATDQIASFTQLQPEPQNPLYFYSVSEGSEGSGPSRSADSYWNGEEIEGDVYFSDGVASFVCGECGGTSGYNGLLATENSLGLWPGDEGNSDDLTGLFVHDANRDITELYFTVGSNAVGAVGSAVESVPANERSCTIFRSALDGSNSVAYTCANLGLVPDDHIDALLVYGDAAPSKIIFSVESGAQGAAGSAVATSVTNDSETGAQLFESAGDGANTLFKDVFELGLNPFNSLATEDLDALAVVDRPTALASTSCNLTYDPFDAAEGAFTTFGGVIPLNSSVLVVAGQTASTARLIAYDPVTCTLLQQKDMPAGFDNPTALAIVPLPGWDGATPLDNVEYLRVASAGPEVERYDASGAPGPTYPIDTIDYYDYIETAIYEPVGDKLYLIYDSYDGARGQLKRLAIVDRPAATATTLTPELHWLYRPVGIESAAVTGIDALGNLYYAQHQSFQNPNLYRVSAFAPNGELQLAPYSWTPEGPIEGHGFIAGTSHFLLSTNSGAGPSAIERGVLQAP